MKDERINCTDVREKLPLFVGQDLEAGAMELVRAHLAACGGCASEASAATRSREVFRASLAQAAAESSGSGLWSEIRTVLVDEGRIGNVVPAASRDRITPRPAFRLLGGRKFVGVAAAAAVLLVASIYGPGLFDAKPGSMPSVVDGSGSGGGSAELVATPDEAPMMESLERELQPVRRGDASFSRNATLQYLPVGTPMIDTGSYDLASDVSDISTQGFQAQSARFDHLPTR